MYSKAFIKAVADYILDEEDVDSVKTELARYKRTFPMATDYNWYMYGNILPYYTQIREFMEKNGMEAPEDNSRLQKTFCVYVRKAIDAILTGDYDRMKEAC